MRADLSTVNKMTNIRFNARPACVSWQNAYWLSGFWPKGVWNLVHGPHFFILLKMEQYIYKNVNNCLNTYI
jgi:hypothetical protein